MTALAASILQVSNCINHMQSCCNVNLKSQITNFKGVTTLRAEDLSKSERFDVDFAFYRQEFIDALLINSMVPDCSGGLPERPYMGI